MSKWLIVIFSTFLLGIISGVLLDKILTYQVSVALHALFVMGLGSVSIGYFVMPDINKVSARMLRITGYVFLIISFILLWVKLT